MFIGPVSILKLIGRPDGFVSIEYVDYAAARHFLTQINEWYEALDFSHESKFLRRIQELSHWFRTLVPASLLCTGVLALGTIYSSKNQDAVLSDLLIAISQISAIAIILWLVGLVLGRLIESTVDRIQPISYVFLNKGDERLLTKWQKANAKNKIFAVIGVLVAVAVNIASAWIFEKLKQP